MESEKGTSLDLLEDELHSKLIFSCLKKCLNRRDISSDTKMRILYVLLESNEYSPGSLHDDHLNTNLFNPLGVDDDLLDNKVASSLLKTSQIDELRRLILEELKHFHSFCSMLKSGMPPLNVDSNIFDSLDLVQKNLEDVNANLELSSKLLQGTKMLRFQALKLPLDLRNKVMAKASKLRLEERALFEQIGRAITAGERREALEKVEHILEKKVVLNKGVIDDLTFEISEYNV